MSVRVIFAGGGTGGHLYPALNIAAAMREMRPDVEPMFVGARRGVEARVLPEKGVPHTLLPLEPIRRDRVWRNWRLVPSMSGAIWGLCRLMLRTRPSLVVGTGGYASGPACGWALLVGVPIALQEQNSYPGLTTRWLSPFARQVHLGFPEAEARLRAGRRTSVQAHGNPILPPDRGVDRLRARRSFGLSPDATVLLVVGGSQGARAINEALAGALEGVAAGEGARPSSLEILWATGPMHIEAVRERLAPLGVGNWVRAIGYIDDMPGALAAADIAVSRAGAMGTAELLAWGIPSILVPLPTSAAEHQTHNAAALESFGAAIALLERDMTPARLWEDVSGLAGDQARRERMAARTRERARPDAARRIAADLLTIVEGR
ncbi:MAG TPA: UDP-N-acetylglucosamine--N-acetylmuramyl-(pentapeptide) pyrophosphoryl-undecaprenol N-acetylglucosamine transferase [Longimicrobiales bacterium]|nr:UDP-N-acetylglucosamine--N-acetylmuramyl-(pentapeptide) pyrophosphoryl-undecaprenol N-acetylglucosamine transferase [Longimicrobiales bacterium]